MLSEDSIIYLHGEDMFLSCLRDIKRPRGRGWQWGLWPSVLDDTVFSDLACGSVSVSIHVYMKI